MKLLAPIAAAIIAAASAGHIYQSANSYLTTADNYQPAIEHQQNDLYNSQPQDYSGFDHNNYNARPSGERTAKILAYEFNNNGHNYNYAYETENGIKAQESGVTQEHGTVAKGSYSYTGDDGKTYTVNYIADANGFRAEGAHLPTPPPVPEAILRSLDVIAKNEAAGIFDDGQYHEQAQHGYQSGHQGYQSNQQGYPSGQQGYSLAQHGYQLAQQMYQSEQEGYPAAQKLLQSEQIGYPSGPQSDKVGYTSGHQSEQMGYPSGHQSEQMGYPSGPQSEQMVYPSVHQSEQMGYPLGIQGIDQQHLPLLQSNNIFNQAYSQQTYKMPQYEDVQPDPYHAQIGYQSSQKLNYEQGGFTPLTQYDDQGTSGASDKSDTSSKSAESEASGADLAFQGYNK